MGQQFYSKIGGDVTFAAQRIAEGLNAIGAAVVLYRGNAELVETGITMAPGVEFAPSEFKRLAQSIIENCYAKSIETPNKACEMLAAATDAEDVVLFIIRRGGSVEIGVSRSKGAEFVAAMALGMALKFEEMN